MGQEECEIEICIQEKNKRKGDVPMLRKSKRILGLVLALIMICSAMGVMAFAVEPELDTSRYYTIPIKTERDGTVYTSYMNISIAGGYSEIDDYSWVELQNTSFYGPWANTFDVSGFSYANNFSTLTVDISYSHGSEFTHCYTLVVELSSTGDWSARGSNYYNGGWNHNTVED